MGTTAQRAPLLAAGFTTAFGAHAVAGTLGTTTTGTAASLLTLGALLAVYDGAEVVLKPVFGTLADRIGARTVLIAGLVIFVVASASYAVFDNTAWLWAGRFGQGVGAAAFSPAASALVALMTSPDAQGRAFGTYGSYKSIGYTLGPLLGGLIVTLGGLQSLFAVMAVLGTVVAVWAGSSVPAVTPLPRRRQTLVDTLRRFSESSFVTPSLALAAATAALSVGVGFLPVLGTQAGLSPVVTGAVVSVLALTTAVAQPMAGRAHDAGRITLNAGIAIGMLLTAAGLVVAALPGLAGLLCAAVVIGTGCGLITPLAFTMLAKTTPSERLGQTMGAAEIGRESGDAAGPLVVASIAAASTVPFGFAGLAVLVSAAGLTSAAVARAKGTATHQ
ncbi:MULTISPECIES: MFS transporter [unclassified Mycobacterium]|uniref:MFS transporter n=1 Tax=unclassified Mycobacterium TaxID=2642494 RepID=UPI000740424D|nr:MULTISPECIES: MFS transporter [unclassified Mycobacterium]KUH80127.1 MFS transporter [Mycobacterium sp. GA-0227b]KUH80722.1 MFS transporter [Mycobacterium sp. IS-1556]KUH82767.1 MFS transporter [Mycobacterium sp. GA-1999]